VIDLGQPALHAEGVLLFPDHADRTRYYYLPDVPRVVTDGDGVPQLQLLEYRYDAPMQQQLGAGLLAFSVDLGVDADRLDRLAGRVAKQNSLSAPAKLGPVSAEAARCELVLIDAQKRTLGDATPSLYGDNTTMFMAQLDAAAVAIVDAALRKGGLPIGIVYSLDVLALRPAIHATITAKWDNIYNFYENRLHGGKILIAADIGETITALQHSEAIVVKVDDLVPVDQQPAMFQRALDEIQRYIIQDFFKPTLSDQPPADNSGSNSPLAMIGTTIKDLAGMFSLTYSLRDVNKSELKTLTFDLSGASAEKLTLSPQGALALAIQGDPARFIKYTDPSASPQMDFDVGTALDLAGDAIDHLEVRLGYGDRHEVVVLDAATPRKPITFWYTAALGPAIQLGWDVAFAAGPQGPAETVHGPDTSVSTRVIRINPRDAYRRVQLQLLCVGVPFDKYPQVIADVEVDDPTRGWSQAQTFTLDAQHAEVTWTVRAGSTGQPRFRRRLRYIAPDGTESPIDWDLVAPGVAIVGNPHPAALDVQILGSARFGTAVAKLVVELRPAAHPEQVASRVLTAAAPSATWSLATDGAEAAYEYRVTVFTTLDEVRAGDWLPAKDATLIVGEGIGRLRQVNLVFVGKTAKDLGLISAKVRFHFEDATASLSAEDEMLVTDFTKQVAWSYPVADPAREAFDWTLTLIHADGTLETRPPVTTSDLLVVVPLV
jgi:hypothetical protein